MDALLITLSCCIATVYKILMHNKDTTPIYYNEIHHSPKIRSR